MNSMRKKGQLAVLSVIFALIVFIVLWVLFFASWVNTWAQQAIVANELVGIEAFLLANMNLWIGLGVVIGVVAFMYFGGGR